jgi:hypothetical protein
MTPRQAHNRSPSDFHGDPDMLHCPVGFGETAGPVRGRAKIATRWEPDGVRALCYLSTLR